MNNSENNSIENSVDSNITESNIAEEIILQDSFLVDKNLTIDEKKETTHEAELKAESSHMPNVLVDELLLSEIKAIPDRFGFKIGDVADLLGIKQYVLRYWEQEFDLLKPKKASNNQRMYTKKDVENAFLIRKLLYRDKFSIEGARRAIKDVKFAVKKEKNLSSAMDKIDQNQSYVQEKIRSFVLEIRKTKDLFN
jgi:DNA-binding transcriptional MerR regulator